MKTIGVNKNKQTDADIESVKKLIIDCLEKNKAENIEVINLAGKTEIASFMVIATGRVGRHIRALADYLLKDLRQAGKNYQVEGMDKKDWVLVDTFDIIVHLFTADARKEYDLESLWKL